MTDPTPGGYVAYPEPTRPPVPQHCTATGCDRDDTATVDGVHGRRCPEHPPTFSRDHATNLLLDGRPAAALAYLRTELPS
jgi:hypothetical protein